MRHVIPEAEIVNQNVAPSAQFAASQRCSVADVMHHDVVCGEFAFAMFVAALHNVSHFLSLIVCNLEHHAWQFHMVAMHDRDFSLHFICVCSVCLQLYLQQHAFRSMDLLQNIWVFWQHCVFCSTVGQFVCTSS